MKTFNNIDNTKERLANDFLHCLINDYGYSFEQLGKNFRIGEKYFADIVIWKDVESKHRELPDICVVVLCKAEHIHIEAEEYINNILCAQLPCANFVVAKNMKETKVFYLNNEHVGSIEEFADFPKASEIASKELLSDFIKRMRNNSKDSLLKAFNKCHNIIRNNDKLSPEAAFDEISKVIFIKMLYERDPKNQLVYNRQRFLKEEEEWTSNNDKGDYINTLLNNVKERFSEDHLFETNETFRIKRESFIQILKELEIIDFYSLAEDIKGIAFEAFLGKTFRGELGQFFTPRTIVNYMVDVLDIKEGELVCDPCCGSGGFLIRAFETVQDNIEKDIQEKLQATLFSNLSNEEKNIRTEHLLKELEKNNPESRIYKLCHNYFFGIDANVRMARTSKMNMIMHGDGHVGVYQHDGLLNVGKIKENTFDVILINPPFGIHIDKSVVVNGAKPYSENFTLSTSNAEQLFIERTIQLLKPGGRAGLVLPEGIFNNYTTQKLRSYVEEYAEILNITSIPADVFLASGANIKPSLLFIRKYTESELASRKKKSLPICACKVTDAGINSIGLPSNNEQLTELIPLVREWIKKHEFIENENMRLIDKKELEDWNVIPFFNSKPLRFQESDTLCKLSTFLTQSTEQIKIEDNTRYKRITVKLFNKGISQRDELLGKEIGTKKQTRVHEGQLIVSKIDAKSGAFGFIPQELEGAIATQDFPIFNIDTSIIVPEYFELIMASPQMLEQIKQTCSGSTGRRRLSIPRLLNMSIPVPTVDKQKSYVEKIVEKQNRIKSLENELIKETEIFNKRIFI